VISWPAPFLPRIPGTGPTLHLYDTSAGQVRSLAPAGRVFTMYVCGITPYDATHLGHAATYVTFDVIQRAIGDAGHAVRYVQNVTDVDDPLFERADRDGVDFRDLARWEIDLFREDMTALAVLPPDEYVGVEESVPMIAGKVLELLEAGLAYRLPIPGADGTDIYLDLASEPTFGKVSGWSREEMMAVYADRGGDPDRPGKRDAFDPLLWRGARAGEPAWDGGPLGPGRPGWHIECTAITLEHLGIPFDLNGGGSDLVFPHHEMSATQAFGLHGDVTFARHYAHQAMVGYHGAKMSKSKGNLVFVSALRRDGVDPMVIRATLLDHHYRTDWEYTDADLERATARLDRWRAALSGNAAAAAEPLVATIRERVCDDLDTPGALAAVDDWAQESLAGKGTDPTAAGVVARTLDALLGIRL